MNNKDDNKIPLPGVYPLEEDPPEVFLALKLITMDHLPTMCKCMSDLLPNKTNKQHLSQPSMKGQTVSESDAKISVIQL